MNDLRKLMDDIISQDEELQKEVDLLKLKYDIIDELISYRKMNNLTQSDFAKVIGVKQQMISRFEKGEVDPRLSFISKVLFGMKKDVIIREENYITVDNTISLTKRKKTQVIPTTYKLVG